MEELKHGHIVNLDFEEALCSLTFKKLSPHKINKELEYLFWWVEDQDKTLKTNSFYKESYLDFIKKYTGRSNFFSKSELFVPWWGNLRNESDWYLEKVINSKVTAFECQRELFPETGIICHIVNNEEELRSAITAIEKKGKDFVCKRPLGFSGRGHSFSISDGPKVFPLLVEEWCHRIDDYGILIDKASISATKNLISERGKFMGAYFTKEEELLPSICQREDYTKIFKYYQKYQVEFLQIDSYSYLEGNELRFRPLCEVNHRKSLGQMLRLLAEKYNHEHSFLLVLPKFQVKRGAENEQCSESFLPLSPLESNLQCFYFGANSASTLKDIMNSWSITNLKPNIQSTLNEFTVKL